MPRLLVASGIFHPEPGGPATYLRGLLPALQARGWDARVLTFGERHDGDDPYTVTRIPRRAYPRRMAEYALAARRELQRADVVFSHTIDLPMFGSRVPRVIKVVGDQAWERCQRKGWIPPQMGIDEFQHFRGDSRVRWQQWSRSRQVRAQDAVITPSEYLRDMALGWGVDAGKVHVIYNALADISPPSESRDEIRAKLGWGDAPVILTVARLQRWKGIDHLIAAIAGLEAVRLVVAGDGPDRGRLESLAAGLGTRIHFAGQRPQEEVARYMLAADGVALYSAYEGLSHTLLESLRLGTPVIASDVGGNREVARHGVNGLLVAHVDVDALRAGIVELLARRDALATSAKSGLDRFHFGAMVEATDVLLRRLANRATW